MIAEIERTNGSSLPTIDEHLREMLALHFHPQHGSRFWLARQSVLGFDVCDRVRCVDDLSLLGFMESQQLAGQSVWDFVPQGMQQDRRQFLTAETGGTTGDPVPAVYSHEDFEAAFVTPFVEVATQIGFPTGGQWLFVGPTGPHIIGKAQRRLAEEMGAPDPWCVDFDPRWVKRLTPGTFAAKRYVDHVLDQAAATLRREEISVLFTTPPILQRLAELLDDSQRERIGGVHYGGMALSAEQINYFREQFSQAVHLSGYGNTLFGCALEVEDTQRQSVDYYPRSPRLLFEVLCDDEEHSERQADEKFGQLVFHRFDRSMLLVGIKERDWATLIPPNAAARQAGLTGLGIRNPGPRAETQSKLRLGIY
ncbi:MAG: long-chain fatty acid--CoA ligase [Planctomycetes bacterium]|nr:long-chain fatty acid--CoA ligase [Planctomycetota bacterium]